MSRQRCYIDGIGFWADGLPDWPSASAWVASGTSPTAAPARPVAELLPANERRRAPASVALALTVAQSACMDAEADPAQLPSIFASCHGDLAITDYMCATLAQAPLSISPTRFHNSVHNAAAGYWTIGSGCHAPTTALSALGYTFAQGLLEGLAQLHAGCDPLLLVAYDIEAAGPLGSMATSVGLVGVALVLSAQPSSRSRWRLDCSLEPLDSVAAGGALSERYAGNAMAPALPLIDLLAAGEEATMVLAAGRAQSLRVTVGRGSR